MPWPIRTRDVNRTQDALGVTFPPDFVGPMTESNGGQVEGMGMYWELCPFRDTSERTLTIRTLCDIVSETLSFRKRPKFPHWGVVIARMDLSCLILRPSDGTPNILEDRVLAWWSPDEEIQTMFGSTAEMMETRWAGQPQAQRRLGS